MSELVEEQPEKISRWTALRENPVTIKELRSRMRGRRAFVVLTFYLVVMSLFVLLVYAAFASASRGPFGPSARDVGKAIFVALIGIQGFLVVFVGPSFTAGAITGEKERQTFDLLRTTLLNANRFVMGKLLSSMSYVYLLIFAAIPLQSLAFLLGGVSFAELFVSQLVLAVAAVTFALWGLFCSSGMKTTLGSSVVTFAGALFITIGTPMLAGFFTAIVAPFFAITSSLSWIMEVVLAYLLIGLAATNLPATLIASEMFLLEEGTLFLWETTVSGGRTIYLISPWPLFMLLYALLAFFLYWLTVRNVRRIATK